MKHYTTSSLYHGYFISIVSNKWKSIEVQWSIAMHKIDLDKKVLTWVNTFCKYSIICIQKPLKRSNKSSLLQQVVLLYRFYYVE